ncbi:helix-turn-helix domain-containing protein [Streptomyces sp. NPDC049602]|uniref:helix-turn-helix domain-containing protein n=1 Tax=Streptomyces sp. NPDC049602 TaxID=3155504 RepID=UPI003413F4BE
MPSGRCWRAGCVAVRRIRLWALRSRIVLECAEGHSITEVSRRLRIAADTVRTWRRRFIERGLDGLCDDPRPGVPRKNHAGAVRTEGRWTLSPAR